MALSAFVFAFPHVDIAAGFCRRAAEVEIVFIECCDLLQPLDLEQGKPMVRRPNMVVPPEPLQDTIAY